jgi:hypothetical protein
MPESGSVWVCLQLEGHCDNAAAVGAFAMTEAGQPELHSANTEEAADQTGFLPSEPPRNQAESVLVRVVATAGVIGIGTAIGAILGAQHVEAWIAALVVSTVCVVLAAVLWRSRRL